MTTEPTPPVHERCWWLREALAADPGAPCPPLDRDQDVDVVVLGGGYTGMWTAYHLTELDPGIRLAILEADICGGGPSGRNGGFTTGWWDEISPLVKLFGEEPARRACEELGRSIAGIGEFCERNDVDAWYTHGGSLTVASSPAQEDDVREEVDIAVSLGAAGEYEWLSADQVRKHCDSPVFGGGAYMPQGATVQPARLARGLRRVLLDRGVRIFEGTRVSRFRAGPDGVVEVETPGGRVRADKAVLALNAWSIALRYFRLRLTTWGSYIVLTPPIPERLEKIGWTGGECITDARFALHYFRTTRDGRIAFGGGGGRAGVGHLISPRLHRDDESFQRAARGFRRLFPQLADVPLEEAWGGPIDVSPTHVPYMGALGTSGSILYAVGYSGNGVAPSHLAGRVLSALATGRDDPVTHLPMVDYSPRRFPPEPLRSVGAYLVREATVRKEDTEDEGGRPNPLVRLLAGLPRRLGYPLGSR